MKSDSKRIILVCIIIKTTSLGICKQSIIILTHGLVDEKVQEHDCSFSSVLAKCYVLHAATHGRHFVVGVKGGKSRRSDKRGLPPFSNYF